MEYKNKMINSVNTKFHPAMADEQRRIDRNTANPINVSNAPDDADHNFHYASNLHQTNAANKVNKKTNSKRFSIGKRLLKKIKKWFGHKN